MPEHTVAQLNQAGGAAMPPAADIRTLARSIGSPVRYGSETEDQARLRRLKECQRAGELLNQLVDRNATLQAQLAAGKDLVRKDTELLGERAARIMLLEDLLGRCLAAWQTNPTWDNRELLAEAQAVLGAAR